MCVCVCCFYFFPQTFQALALFQFRLIAFTWVGPVGLEPLGLCIEYILLRNNVLRKARELCSLAGKHLIVWYFPSFLPWLLCLFIFN